MIVALLIVALVLIAFLIGFVVSAHQRLDRHAQANWAQGALIERLQEGLEQHSDRISTVRNRIDDHDDASGGFWTTGLGNTLRIRDMTDRHLLNAIAWKEQEEQTDDSDYEKLRIELRRRKRNQKMEMLR